MGNILTDAFCLQVSRRRADLTGPATILDNGVVIVSAVSPATTRRLCATGVRALPCIESGVASPFCRAVRVRGQDGREYLLAVNLGRHAAEVRIETDLSAWRDIATGRTVEAAERGVRLALGAGHGELLVDSARPDVSPAAAERRPRGRSHARHSATA